MTNQQIINFREYLENILFAIKYESENKISKEVVIHLIETMIKHLSQICDK